MSKLSLKRSITVATIFVILLVNSSLRVKAEADFDVIRLPFDQVITEKGGVNYVRIHRPGFLCTDIFDARPKLGYFKGTLDANKTMELMAREEAVKEIKQRFLEVLPELEDSAGLRFWSTIIMVDEDPPALYIGLYEPKDSQLRAIANTMENVTKSRGVIIRFYEALSPKDSEDELREAGNTLRKRVKESGQWNPDIPIPLISTNVIGALEVIVNYTETGRIYPDNEYITKVIKSVRDVVGYKIPIVFAFPSQFRTGLLTGSGVDYPGSWTFWFPFLMITLFLATTSYIAFRRMRRRVKMSLETAH